MEIAPCGVHLVHGDDELLDAQRPRELRVLAGLAAAVGGEEGARLLVGGGWRVGRWVGVGRGEIFRRVTAG